MAAVGKADLPDITRYPWQRRKDYLMLVAAVAASDDELHPDELALLRRWMDQFNLPPKSREVVLAIANRQPLKRDAIVRRLRQTDLTYSLMLDLMGMAMADGVLMDKEIAMLRGVAEVLELDPIHFNIMIEFIHSAHQAAQLSSPEPLYEHNIESAFQLMCEQKVRLFKHTLLCVSNAAFDRQLKQRWMKYLDGHANGG
ncbi:MAG TPA: TerB family tellurite resistance protein [bacterium]|nr:TerB family tellurite resistance protein [bacterium]